MYERDHTINRVRPRGTKEQWENVPEFLRRIDIPEPKPAPSPPPMRTSVVFPFPIPALLLLHFLTLGSFTFFWLLLRHGNLAKFREDDPSAAKAITLCFIPFYNLYWLYSAYIRLADRTNQTAKILQVNGAVQKAMAIVVVSLVVAVSGMGLVGGIVYGIIMFNEDAPVEQVLLLFFALPQVLTIIWFLIAMPIFACQVQSLLNRCFERQIESLPAGRL